MGMTHKMDEMKQDAKTAKAKMSAKAEETKGDIMKKGHRLSEKMTDN